MIDTNQTYLSNVVNKYFNCNLKELLNTYRVEYAKELLHAGKCSLAVSYTHLDVYKRQLFIIGIDKEYASPFYRIDNRFGQCLW